MTILEVELPAAYLDALIEDLAVAVVGATPTLINLDPDSGEISIARATTIALDIVTLDTSGTVDLATVRVYVDGALAFNAGTFSAGFDGAASAYSNPHADVLRVTIDPTSNFTSEQLVSVRVVAQASGDLHILDASYNFLVEDFAPPVLVAVEAQDLQRVRCTFNEDVTTAPAIVPGNWRLDRFGDFLDPVVSAVVVGGVGVTSRTVDLYTDIALTPGGHYRLTALPAITDVHANHADGTFVDFTGWQPPVPAGRAFDLYRKLPALNRQEDVSLDLYRFTACLREVAGLLLYDIDRFVEIIDPATAPEAFVDAMLADLGNPFAFDLSLDDKRRLAQVLVSIYRLKGTAIGITGVIRFFLGLDVTVDAFNLSSGTWLLGESELGLGSILGTNGEGLLYSFTVTSPIVALTATQRAQLTSIVEYMKPAHTHFVQLIEPTPIVVFDNWELGLSALGESTFLH